MASKFLRAMAAMKLVDLDESEQQQVRAEPPPNVDFSEIDRMMAQTAPPRRSAPPARPPMAAAPQAAAAPPMTAAPATAPSGIEEGRPFDDIYRGANVAPAVYVAEKLLRVLDGLKAMDPHTRKAAVLAMDAADDGWSVEEVVRDALNKADALNRHSQKLQGDLEAIRANAEQEKKAREDYLARATATIHNKIAELERTLQTEIQQIATQRAEIETRVQNADVSCRRELDRIRAEIARLNEVPQTFAVPFK